MTPLTQALLNAIEQELEARFTPTGEIVTTSFIELDKSPSLRSMYADAPEGTLYLELSPGLPNTRALWMELILAGAKVPMTLITPGEGNGAAVLLFPGGLELYVMGDGAEPGFFSASLSTGEKGPAKWEFQTG